MSAVCVTCTAAGHGTCWLGPPQASLSVAVRSTVQAGAVLADSAAAAALSGAAAAGGMEGALARAVPRVSAPPRKLPFISIVGSGATLGAILSAAWRCRANNMRPLAGHGRDRAHAPAANDTGRARISHQGVSWGTGACLSAQTRTIARSEPQQVFSCLALRKLRFQYTEHRSLVCLNSDRVGAGPPGGGYRDGSEDFVAHLTS